MVLLNVGDETTSTKLVPTHVRHGLSKFDFWLNNPIYSGFSHEKL